MSTTSDRIIKYNPATLELVGELNRTSPDDISLIIQDAKMAQAEWIARPLKERIGILKRLQKHVVLNVDNIVRVICEETGKPRVEAMNADIMSALSATMYSIEMMPSLFQPKNISFGKLSPMMKYLGRRSYIQPRPLGVIVIISPWNYPYGIPFSQAVMAIAAGNSVVLKPSSATPFSGLEVQNAFVTAGVPEHLIQVVLGSGGSVGNALTSSAIDRIIFTGSTEVGKKIMADAANRLTPVTMELGGKDPMIVMADADLHRAAEAAAWGCYVNAGQTCACIKRIYVHDEVYNLFLDLFRDNVSRIKLGYGLNDPEIGMGPLIDEDAVDEMKVHVSRAVEQGGKILFGGQYLEVKGYFFEPTAIIDLPHSSDIVQKEIFGPIVTIHKFQSVEEAISMANDSVYALSGSVWTSDLAMGKMIAERLTGGTINVNNVGYTYGLASTPWGGRGDSGFGHTHGIEGFSELLESHHVHVDRGKFSRELWWHPYGRENLELSHGLLNMIFGGQYSRTMTLLPRMRRWLKGR
ncbi:MAG: aldehyde dehydrogenase family protein [Euryarchaeota archaeon]|nr:aldehyde dehydrogenase family protein [Euryarchaeota archaeon]